MTEEHFSDATTRKKANPVKFSLQLNEEQKAAKQVILDNPITVLKGASGSGKCLGFHYIMELEVDDSFYEFLLKNNFL